MEEKHTDKAQILERLQHKTVGEEVLTNDVRVSVIIPAYNLSELICDTLDSVFAQTYKDFEVIVVNDGSDDTEVLEKKLDNYTSRIIYARQKNSGAAAARNLAMCLASGDLIAFLDGDDLWFPDYLEKQVKFLDKNDLDMSYCDAEFFGETYADGKTYMETSPSDGDVTTVSLIQASCNVITSGTILRRAKLIEFGLFDLDFKRAQDFDLWFRLAKNDVKIGYQREVLLKYRVSSTSLSGSNIQRAERNVSVLKAIKDKYQLTEIENKVLEKQLVFSIAELDLEKGKYHLTEGDYEKAKTYFAKANEYYQKPKLTLVSWAMRFSPALTLKLFKKIRPTEFSFIASNNRSE